MTLRWDRLAAYLVARLNETSSWAGVVLILTASGRALAPDDVALITTLGLGGAGALRVLLPNRLGGEP